MPRSGPGKSTPAIGTPAARLFFEPQKTMAIVSSRLKPKRLGGEVGGEEHEGQNQGLDDDHDCEAADRQRAPSPALTAWPKAP